jgi:hypothetical protein
MGCEKKGAINKHVSSDTWLVHDTVAGMPLLETKWAFICCLCV